MNHRISSFREVRRDRLAPVLGNERRVKRLAGGPWKRTLCDHGVVRRMGLGAMLLREERCAQPPLAPRGAPSLSWSSFLPQT